MCTVTNTNNPAPLAAITYFRPGEDANKRDNSFIAVLQRRQPPQRSTPPSRHPRPHRCSI